MLRFFGPATVELENPNACVVLRFVPGNPGTKTVADASDEAVLRQVTSELIFSFYRHVWEWKDS